MAEAVEERTTAAGDAPAHAPLPRRFVVAATIGNALEFYDFITYAFFAIQIGHAFFPTHERLRQPDAVAGDFRRRLHHPADRRHRHRRLRRPRRPPAGDDAELHPDGGGDHRRSR